MEITQILGCILAVFVGITLGLIGSGGSILSVPVLVYVIGIEPILATAYSLFIVGTSAIVGGVQKANEKLVDFKKVFLFGIPTVIAVFITRRILVPMLPDVILTTNSFTLHKSVLIMVVFAVVMILASVRMLQPMKEEVIVAEQPLNYFKIFASGFFIGCIAGFVGAGGGFLIIPALIFFTKTPMKIAVGTSLFIVATQSLIGFLGDLRQDQVIDWTLLLLFSSFSIVGIFIGNYLSKIIPSHKLKTGFGWFVLAMGIYIIGKELL